jgi:uridylate kinase
MSELKYKRILLKISGEAFGTEKSEGIDFEETRKIAKLIKSLTDQGIEVAVVNGAGNLFRGAKQGKAIDREAADYIGMVATVMNSLALQEVIKELDLKVKTYSALAIENLLPGFDEEEAKNSLAAGAVVISTAGTGKPFFTTDTAGVQRAIDLDCSLMIKASTVDGVYSADPKENDEAEKYEKITFDQILDQDLKVLDRTAVEIAKEHALDIIVCRFDEESIFKAVRGEQIGTHIS